ncbi:right-handed parallel beta-helix repeat-containing protein [Ferruginibacter profundus]
MLVLFTSFWFSSTATNYYFNALTGKDFNRGTSRTVPFQSIAAIAGIQLKPGDSLLFASGQKFSGMISLQNVKGSRMRPIVISAYNYNGDTSRPVLDAGNNLNALLIQNASFIAVSRLEITATIPYSSDAANTERMRCGILVAITANDQYESIKFSDMVVHDIHFYPPGFMHAAAEVKTANGTQPYGWGIRFINNTREGVLKGVQVFNTKIFNVSHTGLKFTSTKDGIKNIEVAYCTIFQTGGPGMQLSGVNAGHIHHNTIDHSGAVSDSRNWGRGSGLWTWGCSNILIEYNRFENANGPGDSAGVHIDYNCSDVIVQCNFSANNAGGFCEILGNNYNCAYRYNISVNDGYRIKGEQGAFQEGKIFWLSGYQGNDKKSAGPYNSYFYNNSIYVSRSITPRIAVSSSANGILIANNIFYFETPAKIVAGDQKKKELDSTAVSNIVMTHNLFLQPDNWPSALLLQDTDPVTGDPGFANKGGLQPEDYLPTNSALMLNKGITISPLPNDSIGLRIGLQVKNDILGNPIKGGPGMGAIGLK